MSLTHQSLVISSQSLPIRDMIPPQLDTYRKRLAEDGYPNASMEDLLSYISFPEVAKTFFGHNR